MKVNCLGDNLNVIILAERQFAHDWMTFGLWYSINKNMPDAQVFVRLTGITEDINLFHWLSKCNIKVARSDPPGKNLFVPSHLVMVRELNEPSITYLNQELLPDYKIISCHAKDQGVLPFVDYRDGCGSFNWSEWIDKDGCPYDIAEGLMTHKAVVNEVKVLQYWVQLGSIYSTISKG